MTDSISHRDPVAAERLLAESKWIRRLARRLVQDGARADDLEQATWIRLLARPPKGEGPVRGWIATVMRNLARQDKRAASRRTRHEEQSATMRDTASPPPPDAALDRAERQREVLDAVMRLPVLYRTPMVMRYLDELPIKRIAAHLDIPVATVKTRLARGLDRLRAELDRRHGGDGRAWLAALLPLAQAVPPPPPLWNPFSVALSSVTTIMQLKTPALVGGLVLAVVGASWLLSRGPEEARPADSPPAAAASNAVAPNAEGQPMAPTDASPTGRRSTVAAATTSAAEEASAAAPEFAVRGRVLTVTGAPVANSEVRIGAARTPESRGGPAPRTSRTAADGSYVFVLSEAPGATWVEVTDPRFTTVLTARPIANRADVLPVVVVAPRASITGRVIDANGAAVADARVAIELPDTLRGQFSEPILDHSADREFAVRTGADGGFALDPTPAVAGAQLTVIAEGFTMLTRPAPTALNEHAVLTLTTETPSASLLEGIVVGPDNTPLADARVACGVDSVLTDSEGRFELDLNAEGTFNRRMREFAEPDLTRVTAVHKGYRPASVVLEKFDAEGFPLQNAEITLQLSEAPLSMAGQVVDDAGEPLAGVEVWIADPTFFGGIHEPGRPFPRLTNVEDVLRPEGASVLAVTDQHGRFELGGLLDRPYVVHAMDPATLLRAVATEARPGGASLRIKLDSAGLFEVLRGRLVDSRGDPIGGVTVFPMCDTIQTKVGDRVVSTRHSAVDGTRSAADGTFELTRVPRDLAYLRIEGPDTIPLEWGRGVEGGLTSLVDGRPEQLEITVPRRCHFRVELADATAADEIEVHDGEGKPLPISAFRGNSRRDGPRQQIAEGRTNQLAVSDAAMTLVLLRADEVVQRMPIRLTPGEPTVIRP